VGWFEGAFWFFDNYLLPLAKILRECEALGVDCDQLLDYATQKRIEWNGRVQILSRVGRNILRENGPTRFYMCG
jgi:hypothetical protein